MAYTQQTWTDLAGRTTPISADRLTYMEAGIAAASSAVMSVDGLVGSVDLSGTYATRDVASVVLLGDSITAQAETNSGGALPFIGHSTQGYPTWLQHYLGHRLNVVKNAGVPGDTTAQILARLSTDVLAYKSRYVVDLSGTNDVDQEVVTAAQIITNKKSLIDQCIANGSDVIALTIPPRAGNATSEKQIVSTVNLWLIGYGNTKPGLRVVNIAPLVGDSGTGEYVAAYTSDGTHPSPVGCAIIGQAVANVLGPLIPPRDARPYWNADPTNLVPNGTFAGSTNGLAWNWSQYTVAGTPALSKVPYTDGTTGQAQQVACGAGDSINMYQIVAATGVLAPGATVQAELGYDIDAGAAFTGMSLYVVFYNSSSAPISYYGDMINVYANLPAAYVAKRGVLQTPAIVVPSAATQVSLQLSLAGAGTFRANWARLTSI